ncbi:MAG: alpha/beta hydrolase [Chloroflexales bacterium]|nr:alpha/beta hydrolase [Chloroflexales bacterium]
MTFMTFGDAPGVTHTVVGNVRVLPQIWSPELQNDRDIFVYLPPSYDTSRLRYPVIYMHDGQNLFDQALSFGDEWQVDETMEALSLEGVEAIVVGVPHAGVQRCNEYSPFGDGCGEAYLAFLVNTLKPIVDAALRTLPGREHTGIVGSSMGGLISLYAFMRHPAVFGFVGALSPSLWYASRAIFDVVNAATAPPGRIYLDIGTAERPAMLHDARRMRLALGQKGYRLGEELCYVEADGARHEEAAWAARLRDALVFLLPSTEKALHAQVSGWA